MSSGKAVVIGRFVDAENHVWGPQAKVFDTIHDAIVYVNTRPIGEDELVSPQHGFVDEVTLMDDDEGIDALIEIVRFNPNVAIKTFRSRHDANSFVSLIHQMAAKQARTKARRIALAS